MTASQHRAAEARPRLLQGSNGWWFLGPGGIARLKNQHLTPSGELRPMVERKLRGGGVFDTRPFRRYSLTVLTSTHCNLGCGYCFQNVAPDASGGNRPPRIGYARLTSSTITAILDFTKRQMDEAGLDQLVVMLMGGEPLLNPLGCRELLARAAGCGLRSASMTSNGVLLTSSLATELAGLGLRDVQVTFDGDREDHDRIRAKRADDGGTFDTIVQNMADVLQATSIRFGIRVNVSRRNHAGMEKLVARLAEGVEPSRCLLYFALVGDAGVGYPNGLSLSADLSARVARWYRRALDLGFRVPRPRSHLPCQACSFEDGRYGAVVNADGSLASCWDTAGKPDWQVGTVHDGYLPREAAKGRWVSCDELNDYGCDPSGLKRFHDTVDAQVLDHMSLIGRL